MNVFWKIVFMEIFWIDRLAEQVNEKFPEGVIHLSCGLSIRGPQHIGRIRGELCLPSAIKRILEEKFGRKAIHYIVLYDMDGLKEKGAKNGFPNDPEKQKKYVGVSLFNVEDPFGCHENWMEHFWADFGDYLDEFGFEVKIVKTSEFYRMEETKQLIKDLLSKREKVVEIVNRYRKRNPWPLDHIPINPICQHCLSINDTKAVAVDLENYTVKYVCNKCGKSGETSLENAKLNWRLEWPALWKVLHIEFEPYGRDHAAAGGSRETCGIFSKEIFGYEPPLGEWYEWVSLKVHGKNLGEMTASGFIGITPKEWLEIATPEILRYLFISTRPHTSITIDLDNISFYYNDYDKAERIYFGVEEESNERERRNIMRSYELAQVKGVRERIPPQVPFDFACVVAQITRIDEGDVEPALEILRRTSHLPSDATEEEVEYVIRRLKNAMNWVKKYAPEQYKIEIKEEVEETVLSQLSPSQKEALRRMGDFLKKERAENEIWDFINEVCEELGVEKKEFFKACYLVLLGKPYGPRLVSIIKSLGEEKISKLFSSV